LEVEPAPVLWSACRESQAIAALQLQNHIAKVVAAGSDRDQTRQAGWRFEANPEISLALRTSGATGFAAQVDAQLLGALAS